MKKPIDHFSLTDWRKSIDEHGHPLFTLTKAEMEAMCSRLEKARELFNDPQEIDPFAYLEAVDKWLASLEREE